MASYERSVLDPVVRRLAEQEATIRVQAEAIGRLTSELETARLTAEATMTRTASSPAPEASWSERAEAAGMLATTTLPPFLAPLVAELSALRQACERQSAEIAQLREERGWSNADLRPAQARIETLESSGRDWHRWANVKLLRTLSAVAVLAMLLLAILDASLW
jgi:hypothetical protein